MTAMKTVITSVHFSPFSVRGPLPFSSRLRLARLHLPDGHAVSPPPDGGYPGGNTAEGQSALLSLTSGTFNTAIGFLSLSG